VLASYLGVARVNGAGVLVVAEGSKLRSVDALSSLVLGVIGPVALIIGASVVVVTISVDGAGRRRAFQVSVVDIACGRVADV